MLKDRGKKKWQGFFMHEHVALIQNQIANDKKKQHPEQDEDKLNDIDIMIHEAMEYNHLLKYSLFNDGYITTLIGRTVYIDYLNNRLRIQDEKESIQYISFRTLVDVEKA